MSLAGAGAPACRRVGLFALLLLVALAAPVTAADDDAEAPAAEAPAAEVPAATLSFDPDWSIETGAHVLHTTVFLLGETEARLFRPLDERPAVGIPLRALRTGLLDLPVAWWFGVVQHEVFGHGGRAREFGSSASYHIDSPWAGRRSYSSFGVSRLSREEIQRVYIGGSESNGWSATLLEREMAAGQPLNPLELLYLASSRFVTSDYVLRTTPDPAEDPQGFFDETGGGDVATYLGFLNERYTGSFGITRRGSTELIEREYDRLEKQAWWNALDPGTWIGLYLVGRHVITGEAPRAAPLPRIGGRRLLPIFSADWYPDGGAAAIEVVVAPGFGGGPGGRARWSSVVLRRGDGPGGDFWAAGYASERLFTVGPVRVGGEAEAWTRPGESAGGGARLWVSGGEGPLSRFFVEVGAKSHGHWPGRPAGNGAFFRFGYRARLSRPLFR